MDELEISGKRYISSRRAGKEHKYHPDYIGQLVRAGKVEGQKVGRAWYVREDSLTEYLSKESASPKPLPKVEAPIAAVVERPIETKHPQSQPLVHIEIKEEEIEAPVALAEKTPEDPESHRIPVKKVSEQRTGGQGGLRYISDDSPFFPPIQRIPMTTAPLRRVDVEAVKIIEKKYSPKPWRILVVRFATLLVIGGVSFGLVALLSVKLNSVTTVEGSQPASVQYSF
jgi:hypothetical protein